MTTDKITPKPKIPDTPTLQKISARLFDRADEINQVTLADLAHDLRLAGIVYDKLASIRLEISEIAAKTKDPDSARELRDLLDNEGDATNVAALGADYPGHNPPLGYEALTLLSGRLRTHADDIEPSDRKDISADIRLAARAAGQLASLRFRIGEIAEQALAHPEWDRGAFARDLRVALGDTAEGN
jgi:hypothetical protein